MQFVTNTQHKSMATSKLHLYGSTERKLLSEEPDQMPTPAFTGPLFQCFILVLSPKVLRRLLPQTPQCNFWTTHLFFLHLQFGRCENCLYCQAELLLHLGQQRGQKSPTSTSSFTTRAICNEGSLCLQLIVKCSKCKKRKEKRNINKELNNCQYAARRTAQF